MVTTQLQVLLYVGSHQLESILAYLPLPHAITTALSSVIPEDAGEPSSSSSPSPSTEVAHKDSAVHKLTKRDSHGNSYYLSTSGSSPQILSEYDYQSLQIVDSADCPSSTTCIKISVKPKALRFLGLGFSRNTYLSDQRGVLGHYSYKDKHGRTTPRITSVLFTFPFPLYDHDFPSMVQVTGTFDDWQRSNEGVLTKNEQEGRFEAEVQVDLERLPLFSKRKDSQTEHGQRKIVYKFVIDGRNWVTDPGQLLERDYEGNLNNVMFLEDRAVGENDGEQEVASVSTYSLSPETTSTMESQPQIEVLSETKDDEPQIPSTLEESITNALVIRHQRTENEEFDGDGKYGVVIVQGEPLIMSIAHPQSTADIASNDPPFKTFSSNTIASTATSDSNSSTTTLPLPPSYTSSSSNVNSSSTLNIKSTAIHRKFSTPSYLTLRKASLTKLYNDNSIKAKSDTPTIATTTATEPKFPSILSLFSSNKSEKSHKKKTLGIWKKLKKALK
ncbi:hypothetical protein BGX26_004563 [Mortierella sp. AD094]|nr:hypothetical protein BGX26_004563 [Mortierella sp. AD094]